MIEFPQRPHRPTVRTDAVVSKRLLRPAEHGARPGRVALASAVVVLVMIALVALTNARSQLAARVASPLTEKLAGADRVSYYMLPEVHERGPSFRLRGDDTSIKLITHLVLPPHHVFNPDDDYAYGVRVSLETLEGEETWSHEVNIRTRQSKSDPTRYGWRNENAFLLADPEVEGVLDPSESGFGERRGNVRELTDDRLTRVQLPADDRDRRLRLSFVPREPSVGVVGLARMYVRRRRPVDERKLNELSLAPEAARDLVDHLTYRDWAQLSEEERLQKLSWLWTRLAAEGEPGVDYEIMSIYETGYRLPRGTQLDEPPLLVDPARSLAVNVINPDGPIELRIDGMADPERMARLRIYALTINGPAREFARSRAHSRTVPLGKGVHTLVFASDQPTRFTLQVAEASQERYWLIEGERPQRFNEDGAEMLEPDMRRIQAIHVGGEWDVVPRWSIEGPADPVTRMLRFDVRAVHPDPWRWWGENEAPPTPALELCFYDDEGARLRCDEWRGRPAVQSHFEGLLLADQHDAEDPTLSQARQTRWYAASEPQTLRAIAPQGSAIAELRATGDDLDQRLIVRGYGYWPEVETVIGLPFQRHIDEALIWRYPPLETRTWFPMRPLNYDDLQDEEAVADLHAQVRLQPRGPGGGQGVGRWAGDPDLDDRVANELSGPDGWDPGPWITLQPRGIHRRRSILEELDDEAASRLVDRWDGSLFTELWPNRRLVTDFSATGPSAPELHWQVEPGVLGEEIELTIDGQRYTHRVLETRGRWQLPVARGRVDVRFAFPADNSDYEMWIDRPILMGTQPVSRRRVVHELTRELVFPLIKRGPEPLTVNIVLYILRSRDEQFEVSLQIDDGRPTRREGEALEHLSRAYRTYTIDKVGAYDERDREQDLRVPIRFHDIEGANRLPLDVVTVQITLGEDVVPGAHEVSIALSDNMARVWARAFHRGISDRSKSAAAWTETTDERVAPVEKGSQR